MQAEGNRALNGWPPLLPTVITKNTLQTADFAFVKEVVAALVN